MPSTARSSRTPAPHPGSLRYYLSTRPETSLDAFTLPMVTSVLRMIRTDRNAEP
jgi:hypothetical protein